jgi:hypothetical protein
MPTLLSLVSRVRREVTKETLVTLNDDATNNLIVDNLNDAVDDIYFRAKWSWAKSLGNIVLVAGQSEYTLPANFHRMASEVEIGVVKLREVDAEEWTRYTYQSPSGISTSGQPVLYMVERGFIKFWPCPNADYIAQVPTVPLLFYRRPSTRLTLTNDSANAFDLPYEFVEAIVRYAIARLKIFRQFDDYKIDMDRYEEIVQRQLYADTISVHPSRVRPRNWASANYG